MTVQLKKSLLTLLERDARLSTKDLANILNEREEEIERVIRELEKDKAILGYNTVIDWQKAGESFVSAIIEVNLTPQREVGFDEIAKRIAHFDEVSSVYLMSGSFDLLVTVVGASLQEIADFIATRLATIGGVTSTRSHFQLRQYKKDGKLLCDEEKDRRLVVTP